MTDTMRCRARVGEYCVTTRGSIGGWRYRLRIVASVTADGWIESTRDVRGRHERRRASDETIYCVVLKPHTALFAAELVKTCVDRRELEAQLRPLRDEAVYVKDERIDGVLVGGA